MSDQSSRVLDQLVELAEGNVELVRQALNNDSLATLGDVVEFVEKNTKTSDVASKTK